MKVKETKRQYEYEFNVLTVRDDVVQNCNQFED